MKILLIAPLVTRLPSLAKLLVGEVMEPMGLAYLAACVRRAGHTAAILDRRVALAKNDYDLNRTDKDTLEMCALFQPDVVGLCLSSAVLEDVGTVISMVREYSPSVPIIGGGPHATLFPESTLRSFPELNLVVIGEGEETIVDLLSGCHYEQVSGIAYQKHGNILRTTPRPLLVKLDSLPLPARDLLNLNFYLNPSKNILVDYRTSLESIQKTDTVRMGEMLTTRGCPFSCSFCSVPDVSGRKVRYHGTEYVLADLNDIAERGANYVYMNDDVFTADRSRTMALCEAIEAKRMDALIPWVAQSRAESVDFEMLHTMKRAGCVRVEFGFETASPRLLALTRKRGNPKTYLRAVALAHEVGVAVQANMIVGFPTETIDDIKKSLEFLRIAKPESVLLNVFWPLPGTSIWYDLASGLYPLSSGLGGPEFFRIDAPLRMAAHPMLVQHNFTQMPDHLFKDMVLTYLEYAPEALTFYQDNKSLFHEVLTELGGIFA